MELLTVVAPVFGTNCYVIVADDSTCVIVDAGAGVAPGVRRLVAERGLTPVAVLATHGHADHTWDGGELTSAFDVPFVLHTADAYRLADPFGTLGPLGATHDENGPLARALVGIGAAPATYRAPGRVEPFGSEPGADGRTADVELQLGGVRLVARHAPGHTEGSTLYLLDSEPAVALTGDVLFAGSIGRSDLPGGDAAVMSVTLRDVVRHLDPQTLVLPGHGPSSRLGDELRANPYLRG
ncbi:MBL fold metallo-hydrolase [Cellulomonas sp. WB94]|uniref:MBL fold metallo-hydrolase n=1 Tax=Cellulomonas sp. WB94 TaxID=2173174 RepID=UPI000D56B20B|nr:MBL fold metallo-hydrolase [Cellulomonas sp. WB94]PVU81115.1 MBL fold metallo-hydrolase [Cellulomonas sp. WB94]